jgi:Xaa-Pro aminopeptidase
VTDAIGAVADERRTSADGQPDITSDEYATRRERVFGAIGPDALAVVQGAPAPSGFFPFRQTNEFYYLCGIAAPHAYLLLNGRTRQTTLYLPHRDPRSAESDGEGLSAEDEDAVRQLSGVDSVAGPERLASDLAAILWRGPAPALYTPFAPAEAAAATRDMLFAAAAQSASDPWDGSVAREARFVRSLGARFPQLEVRDLSPILDRLRLIKSAAEVALLRRAARLCGRGIVEAMRVTTPGAMEYQLAAIAHLVFASGGAQGDGYQPIVASGANAWYGHYSANNSALRAGDLVLMDYAPDYHYYTSDIGRMWPVDGIYRPWQRELYGFMVEYHTRLLARIRPGVTAAAILEEAAGEMGDVIARTAFSKPIYEQAARRALEFSGHLSHSVGMSVHDVGDYRHEALAPGLVFAVDPMMWVPEERLYVRVEDTVVVTDDGIENLTGFVPRTLDEVERVMREPGLLQRSSALNEL